MEIREQLITISFVYLIVGIFFALFMLIALSIKGVGSMDDAVQDIKRMSGEDYLDHTPTPEWKYWFVLIMLWPLVIVALISQIIKEK